MSSGSAISPHQRVQAGVEGQAYAHRLNQFRFTTNRKPLGRERIMTGKTVGFIGLGYVGRGHGGQPARQGQCARGDGEPQARRRRAPAGGGRARGEDAGRNGGGLRRHLPASPARPRSRRRIEGETASSLARKPGLVVIDCSTSEPDLTLRLAAAHGRKGRRDGRCPARRHAGRRQGGHAAGPCRRPPTKTFARAEPLIACWAATIAHVGPVGAGHKMKLINNFLSLGYAALYSEALALGQKVGISPETFHSVIGQGRMRCGFYDTFMTYVIKRDENAHQFTIANAYQGPALSRRHGRQRTGRQPDGQRREEPVRRDGGRGPGGEIRADAVGFCRGGERGQARGEEASAPVFFAGRPPISIGEPLEGAKSAMTVRRQSAVIDAERLRWRLQWLACLLQDFADLDLQGLRMWLDPSNTNPHWSYVEFMRKYFDDTLHSSDYSWALREGRVTPAEVDTSHRCISCWSATKHRTAMIGTTLLFSDDPAWRDITFEADAVWSVPRHYLRQPSCGCSSKTLELAMRGSGSPGMAAPLACSVSDFWLRELGDAKAFGGDVDRGVTMGVDVSKPEENHVRPSLANLLSAAFGPKRSSQPRRGDGAMLVGVAGSGRRIGIRVRRRSPIGTARRCSGTRTPRASPIRRKAMSASERLGRSCDGQLEAVRDAARLCCLDPPRAHYVEALFQPESEPAPRGRDGSPSRFAGRVRIRGALRARTGGEVSRPQSQPRRCPSWKSRPARSGKPTPSPAGCRG